MNFGKENLRIVHQPEIVSVADMLQAVLQSASILLNVHGTVIIIIIIIIITDCIA